MQTEKPTLKNKIVQHVMREKKKTFCPPFVTQGTFTMLYAPKGVGKSHFAFNMALAIVKGSNWLGEKCKSARVLYIDGEMGADSWIQRLPKDQVFPSEVTENLHLINPEDFPMHMVPSLADPANKSYWLEQVDPFDVVIIDNYLTTVYPRTNKDSDLTLWYDFLKLLLALKTKNKAVVIVHHTTKTGVQYGSVLKENQMNTILRLRMFPEQLLNNGLTWEVKIEKDRDNVFQKETEFVMDIIFTDQEVYTQKKNAREMRKELVEQYQKKGMSRSEIAQALGVETFQIAEFLRKKTKETNDQEDEKWI